MVVKYFVERSYLFSNNPKCIQIREDYLSLLKEAYLSKFQERQDQELRGFLRTGPANFGNLFLSLLTDFLKNDAAIN